MASKISYTISSKTQEVVDDYKSHIGGGFAPYPVAITKALGAKAWDVDGKEYIDFLSGYAVVNMGHSHPKILAAALEQMEEAAVVNLPWHSPLYGKLAKKLSQMFGYQKYVAMTSGAEAVDAAVKIARKWGYLSKKIPEGECHILTAAACYHGTSISTTSLASKRNDLYGPFVPSVGPTSPSGKFVEFGVIEDLKEALEKDGDKIAAFCCESIQGAAGKVFLPIIVPPKGYLKEVAALCKKHNVLYIADEVQAGLGRCGADLAHLKEGVRPDLVVLGKALAGGMYALSGVLGDVNTIDLVDNFELGSTMAANPPACAAAIAAMEVLVEEKLSERANELGEFAIATLKAANLPYVKAFMGSGLFWSVILDENLPEGVSNSKIVGIMIQRGVLAGAGKGRARICPPLTISKEELAKALEVMIGAFRDVKDVGEVPMSASR